MIRVVFCGLLVASFSGFSQSQRQAVHEEFAGLDLTTPREDVSDAIGNAKFPLDVSDLASATNPPDTWTTVSSVTAIDSDAELLNSVDVVNTTKSVPSSSKSTKERKRQRSRQRSKQSSKKPSPVVQSNAKPANQTLEVFVNRTNQSCGFSDEGIVIDVGNRTENVYRVCYNEIKHFTYFVKSQIRPEALVKHQSDKSGKGKKFQLRFWAKRGIHSNIDIDDLYKKNKQLETVNSILGPNAAAYVNNSSRSIVFLSRGHLAPRADFADVIGQKASYNFLNVAPQWQIINAGSWGKLEIAIRNLAVKNRVNLEITTGTWGILQLADANGTFHDIYLGTDENNNRILPVPKYFWKIVKHQDSRNATAFIVINNPHLKRVAPADIFCADVCHEISWVNWPTRSFNKGFMFCCSVDDLRAKVNYVPFSSFGLDK